MAQRTLDVVYAPQLLFINLARFKRDRLGARSAKDRSPVMISPSLVAGGALYHLVAVIVHHGVTLDGGHYTTLRRDRSGPDMWVLLNDDAEAQRVRGFYNTFTNYDVLTGAAVLLYDRLAPFVPAPFVHVPQDPASRLELSASACSLLLAASVGCRMPFADRLRQVLSVDALRAGMCARLQQLSMYATSEGATAFANVRWTLPCVAEVLSCHGLPVVALSSLPPLLQRAASAVAVVDAAALPDDLLSQLQQPPAPKGGSNGGGAKSDERGTATKRSRGGDAAIAAVLQDDCFSDDEDSADGEDDDDAYVETASVAHRRRSSSGSFPSSRKKRRGWGRATNALITLGKSIGEEFDEVIETEVSPSFFTFFLDAECVRQPAELWRRVWCWEQ